MRCIIKEWTTSVVATSVMMIFLTCFDSHQQPVIWYNFLSLSQRHRHRHDTLSTVVWLNCLTENFTTKRLFRETLLKDVSAASCMISSIPFINGNCAWSVNFWWQNITIVILMWIDWLIEHGFTSAPTQYRLYGRRFLQVWWPNQQCQSTEGGG